MANVKQVFLQKKRKSRNKPKWLGIIKLTLVMLLILMVLPDWQFNLPNNVFREIPKERMTTANCDGFINPGNEIHRLNSVLN